MSVDRYYARHLPYFLPGDFPIFLTWNLKGAMPRAAIEELARERTRLEEQAPRPGESAAQRRIRNDKKLFAIADRFLDRPIDDRGPLHLQDPRSARIVEDSILFGADDEQYDVFAWCVMANHVHVLLTPHQKPSRVTQGINGSTARRINRLHDAEGRTFWQDESYDHWARDEDEIHRIIFYIENNPVAAGLCRSPEEWTWSSARRREPEKWAMGTPYVQPGSNRSASG